MHIGAVSKLNFDTAPFPCCYESINGDSHKRVCLSNAFPREGRGFFLCLIRIYMIPFS